MRKRRSNAMEAGEKLSPPRKKKSLCPSTYEDEECNEDMSNLDYDPVRFLRCHSKTKRDIANLSTQVWYCEFEPCINNPNKTTQFVATCGGNSVCVIDVTAQDALIERKYFSPDMMQQFYSLSWTTLWSDGVGTNILAAGGSRGGIHLFHPESNCLFLVDKMEYRRVRTNQSFPSIISSLKFDKTFPSILYCSVQDEVYVFDIGCPVPPHFDTEITLLHRLQVGSEIVSLAISTEPHVLLAAGNDGLYAWEKPNSTAGDNHNALKLVLPSSETAAQSGTSLVDSVVCLSNGQVAAKCALHGRIYVWDLAQTLASGTARTRDVVVARSLRWSDTDNYFMNIGFAPGSSLLACGDDKGGVWVYDLTKNTDEPTTILEWPIVEDPFIAKSKKLRANVYDIVVDKVNFNWSGKYMVAVTSNNMVCIWKRV